MGSSELNAPQRSDLLQVQTGTNVVPARPEVMLERMGFQVRTRAEGHWIVTGVDPLPEFHFYSRIELGRFALDQAKHYQEWLNWRQHHDTTTPLSG